MTENTRSAIVTTFITVFDLYAWNDLLCMSESIYQSRKTNIHRSKKRASSAKPTVCPKYWLLVQCWRNCLIKSLSKPIWKDTYITTNPLGKISQFAYTPPSGHDKQNRPLRFIGSKLCWERTSICPISFFCINYFIAFLCWRIRSRTT